MSTNEQRARWAEASLQLFITTSKVDDLRDAVGDMIANLGHFADVSGLPFLDCVATGIGHWHLETQDEDSIDALPRVTITIHE